MSHADERFFSACFAGVKSIGDPTSPDVVNPDRTRCSFADYDWGGMG